MKDANPFKNPNIIPRNEMGFTKQLKTICNTVALGDSLSVEIKGMSNKSLKALLSKNFRGQFTTMQFEGVTWIKRIV